jgi:pSer/pThr/pTyr-binding forkhead associated (FHA) protein
VVEDLDSANGTYVNARRIKGRQELRSGDRLEVGPVRFILRFDDPAAVVEPVEDVAEVEAVEDSVLELAPVAEESGLVEAKLVGDDEETADEASAEVLEVLDEMDKAEGWHLPESEDFRDLLTRMEETDPPKKPRKE